MHLAMRSFKVGKPIDGYIRLLDGGRLIIVFLDAYAPSIPATASEPIRC